VKDVEVIRNCATYTCIGVGATLMKFYASENWESTGYLTSLYFTCVITD